MVKDKKLAIIVPCYNEINTILKLYNKIKNYGIPIIVDDCSNDGTQKLLDSKNINFIKNKKRSGYEQSIINGINYVNKNLRKINFLATIDADLELPPVNLLRLYKKAKKNNYDLVIGARKKLNRISEYLLSLYFKFRFKIEDPITGLKIYKANKIKSIIKKVSNNFFLVDILIFYFNKKYSFCSVKILPKKRKDYPRVGRSLAVNIKIIKILFFCIFFRNRMN